MATVMQSLCYHVYATARGWEVAFDHDQPLRLFSSQNAAVVAARAAAEARWLLTNKPTCVGLGKPDEEVVIVRSYPADNS